MAFAGVDLLMVGAAALTGFLMGGLWYGVLGKVWMAAAGLSEADIKGKGRKKGSPRPFLVAIVADLLLAFMFAWLFPALALNFADGESVLTHMGVAGLVWLGFVLTTLSVNNAFQMKPFVLTLIDAGCWSCR